MSLNFGGESADVAQNPQTKSIKSWLEERARFGGGKSKELLSYVIYLEKRNAKMETALNNFKEHYSLSEWIQFEVNEALE